MNQSEATPTAPSAQTDQNHDEIFGTNYELASPISRLIAVLIDGLILGFVSSLLSIPIVLTATGTGEPSFALNIIISSITWILNTLYYVYFIGAGGQTPGKQMMKIKVVKRATPEPPGYIGAFLREIVGKFISGLIIGLGYIWILFDKDKQGWHDKIADTVVIRI